MLLFVGFGLGERYFCPFSGLTQSTLWPFGHNLLRLLILTTTITNITPQTPHPTPHPLYPPLILRIQLPQLLLHQNLINLSNQHLLLPGHQSKLMQTLALAL